MLPTVELLGNMGILEEMWLNVDIFLDNIYI